MQAAKCLQCLCGHLSYFRFQDGTETHTVMADSVSNPPPHVTVDTLSKSSGHVSIKVSDLNVMIYCTKFLWLSNYFFPEREKFGQETESTGTAYYVACQ